MLRVAVRKPEPRDWFIALSRARKLPGVGVREAIIMCTGESRDENFLGEAGESGDHRRCPV